MKLSQYAKQQGISYRTALRWWKAGLLNESQATTGTIIVTEEPPKEAHVVRRVANDARVSSHEHRPNLEQMERLEDYCAARGYQIATAVKEIASKVNDARPNFWRCSPILRLPRSWWEHQDRATRFGFRYLENLPGLAGRWIDVVNLAETDREDLLADLVSIVYSFAARLYGQREPNGKRKRLSSS